MIRVDEVRARVEALVPALTGKMGSAGDFGRLVERNQLPQQTPAGFVLPGRLTGGDAQLAAGAFVQSLTDGVGIVLAVRVASDPTGARGLDEVTPLARAVVRAVCGWGPDDAPGVFTLASGELVGTAAGVLVYQIDFLLNDQLRITS